MSGRHFRIITYHIASTDIMQETEQVNKNSLDPWENPTLIKFVQTGIFPEKVSKSLQNKIIHQSQKLGWENNKLNYFPIKNNFNNKLEIPHLEDRSLIIADTHQLGHFGPQSTYQNFKSRYYWKRMFLMIIAFIQHCLPCQRHKRTRIYEHPAFPLPI